MCGVLVKNAFSTSVKWQQILKYDMQIQLEKCSSDWLIINNKCISEESKVKIWLNQ